MEANTKREDLTNGSIVKYIENSLNSPLYKSESWAVACYVDGRFWRSDYESGVIEKFPPDGCLFHVEEEAPCESFVAMCKAASESTWSAVSLVHDLGVELGVDYSVEETLEEYLEKKYATL